MQAVIYTRFSPRPQKKRIGFEDGQTIESQVETCERYCRWRGFEVAEVIRDPHQSARLTPLFERPGGQRLRELFDMTDVVVASKLDRIFRNTEDGIAGLRRFHRAGIEVHLADQGGNSLNVSTSIGRFLARTLLSAQEYEVDMIGERTREIMQFRSRSGQRMTRSDLVPYGMQADGARQVVNPEEQEAMALVQRLRQDGRKLREICRIMTSEGIFIRNSQWHPQMVKRILKATAVDTGAVNHLPPLEPSDGSQTDHEPRCDGTAERPLESRN